jgi:guanosine-3',5'-bis(diphosphate) 3'-pyrophosphohydrolase
MPDVSAPSPEARLLHAAHFAATRHRDQRRKDVEASPYINHPLAAAELLARVGGVTDTDTLLAAILHDTVEDTTTSFDELEELFGRTVRDLVAEVTDDKTLEKAERKRQQVAHVATASVGAKLLKLADKSCNVADVLDHPGANWSVQRRREYIAWAVEVIAGCRGINAAMEQHFDALVARGQAELVG